MLQQRTEPLIERRASLRAFNTFGLPATAATLVRLRSPTDVKRIVDHAELGPAPKLILGGGSNLVLTRDVAAVVLKVEIWHDFVAWTLQQGWPGLENLALIPGSAGAAPVQNIGAYGVELKDRFDSLDGVDLVTGRSVTLDAGQCAFGYRDSVFKHLLAGKTLITRVRLRLPRPWTPVLGYLELQRRVHDSGNPTPDAGTVFDWVCAIRRAKLPDPLQIGNAGSFFKNPIVSAEQCRDIIGRDPSVVHYPLPDGSAKLAAGWLIDACGWKGKTVGQAAVYEKQALVLVNRGHGESSVTGGEVMTLAKAIQTSVYERFGIRLEPEPVVV